LFNINNIKDNASWLTDPYGEVSGKSGTGFEEEALQTFLGARNVLRSMPSRGISPLNC
jgi:hypothetical protein